MEHGCAAGDHYDNEFAIWRALGNHAWPAKYVFDGQGKLVKRFGRAAELLRRLRPDASPSWKMRSPLRMNAFFSHTWTDEFHNTCGLGRPADAGAQDAERRALRPLHQRRRVLVEGNN